MPVKTGVNYLSVVHAGSMGMTIIFPDVCLTPAPPAPSPIPIPYPNFAMSSDSGSTASTVKIDGQPVCLSNSNFSKSNGDEAGVAGGVASGVNMNKAEFVLYSFDTKMDGKNVPRAFDIMLHNSKNTPPGPVLQIPIITMPALPETETPKEWSLTQIQIK